MIYTWKSHRLYSLTDELKGVYAAILDKSFKANKNAMWYSPSDRYIRACENKSIYPPNHSLQDDWHNLVWAGMK